MSRFQDLTGQRFGKLFVLSRVLSNDGKTKWLCKCDCGKEKVVNAGDLKTGRTKSCGGGIHQKGERVIDLTGNRYGRLTVLSRANNSQTGSVRWLCKCDCGNEKIVYRSALRNGATISCGCWQKDNPSFVKHHMSKSNIYKIWCNIKSRCYNSKSRSFPDYGGRGIRMCDEWLNDPMSFIKWSYANGYDEDATPDECSIDRIDVNGNYEPTNCRWADVFIQANNKRRTKRYEYNGVSHTIAEWSRIVGINQSTLYNRVIRYGWSIDRALTETVGKQNGNTAAD